MNQEVVKVVLQFEQDIRENPELLELVKEYFENSTQTLDFCSELEKCLERAKDSQSLMLEALRVFNEESGFEGGNIRYVKTLEELKKFKAAGDPFPDEFIKIFQSFCDHQKLMHTKLETRKKQLEEKLNTSQAWRMICSIIFAAMVTGVLIFSVVGVAIAAPQVGVAVAAAGEPPLACMGTWIDSRWKKFKNAVKGQKDVIQSMEGYVGSRIAIAELDNIYEIIENLDINIKYLLKNEKEEEEGCCDVVKEEEVKKEIEEINKKMEVFKRDVELLGKHTCQCIQDVQRARTEVLKTLIKPPNAGTQCCSCIGNLI
ncbi:hypothetical protein Vadar_033183 [Vaccinium darrowii]|uniref:Uncharacterized protein n=1 Tax=Vaccinium darrowii TaxID=229202 RepID=A0ACB7X5Z2_9ERIC|nr:hypothetical protein Vadar_033183 [Vaccinium darrowii]